VSTWPINETREDLVLTWKRFAVHQSVPACVRDAKVEAVFDYIFEGMVIRATGHVLGQQLPSHTETATGFAHFEAPATWWQHFKQQHGQRRGMRLLVRKRPVRMNAEVRRVTLTATWENMAAYPWAEIATIVPGGRLGEPVRLTWLTSSLNWESDTP
jgi:hypothetical protein